MNNQLLTPETQTHHNQNSPFSLSLPTLLNNLPGMAYRCQNDENWTMEFVSGGAESLTGYPPEALVGNKVTSFGALIHSEDQAPVNEMVQSALAKREPFQATYRIRDAHGKEKWVWEQGQGIFENDTLQALEGFITDITALHQTEAALRESETRFRTLIQSSKDAVILSDETGLIVGWNSGAAHIFGYEEDEILGQPISVLMPERYRESHQRGMGNFMATGEGRVLGRTVEMHGRRKDGSDFPLDVTLNSWTAPDGSRYFNGMIRDISERKAVEAGLVEYTKQLQTAADLAQQINNILDPDILLQEIVQQLHTRFSLYHVHIYLVDDSGENIEVRAGSGDVGATLVAHQHRISLEQENSLVAQAARTREIVNVSDVRRAPNFLPNPLLPDTRSEVAIPLVASSQLIGVLDIQDNITDRFNTSDLDVFRALSGQIATTLENSKLFRQVESNLAETQSRLLVTETLAGAESEADVIEALFEQGAIYRDTMLTLALWVPDAGMPTLEMRRSTSYESGVPAFTEGSKFPANQFPILDSLSPTETFVTNDIANDPRYDENARTITNSMGARSAAAIPLTVRGEWLGAMVLISPQVDYFDEHKLFLYRALAEQGAEAIARARLQTSQKEAVEASATYTRQLQTAAELAGRIASYLKLEELLSEVVTELQNRFDLYHVHVYLLDEVHERLVMAQGSGAVGETLRERAHQIPLHRAQSLVARAARNHELVVVHDVREVDTFLPNPLLPDTQSEVSVPLIVAGKVLGVLDVQDNRPNRFTQGDLDVFRTLAGLVATALQNAELYQQVELNLAETENRLRVSQALVGAETEPEVLDAIIKTGGFYRDTMLAVALWVKGAEKPTVEIVRSNPFDSGMPSFPDGTQFTVEQFPMIALLNDTEPFVSANIQTDERVSESSRMAAEMMGQKGAAIIPMKVGGEWVGGLVIASNHDDYFDDAKMSLYLALANQGSEAMTRARLRAANADLFRQVETNLAETENRLRVSQALAGAETEPDVLDAIIKTGGFYRDTMLAVALWVKGAEKPTVEVVRSNPFDSGMPSFPEGVQFTTIEFPIISLLNNTEPFVSANLQVDERVSESSRAAAQMLGQTSAAIIPMNVRGEWVGGLVVASRHESYFDEHKMFLYRALADQGSEALTRARLRADTLQAQTNAERERALLDQILNTLPNGVMVMDTAGLPIRSNNAALNYMGRSINADAGIGDYSESYMVTREDGTPYPDTELPLVKTLTDRGTYSSDDLFVMHANGHRLNLVATSAPLYSPDGEFVGGVLSFTDITPVREASEERARYTRQLQTAAELAGRINTILDLDELLTETVSQLQNEFDLYHVHIYLRDEVSNNLVMLKGSGSVGERLRERQHAIPSNSERSLVARAARSQHVVVVNDIARETGFLPNPLLPDTQSEVAIPLVSSGRVLGVLDVQDNEPHRFTQAELDVLRTLAGLIATSLQNAELYEQVEQSLKETRLRLKVSQAFAGTQTEQEVRDTIFDLVTGVGDAQVNLFLIHEEEGERTSTVYKTYSSDPNNRSLPVGMRFRWNDFPMSKFIESRDTLFVTANAFEDSRVDEGVRGLLMQTGAISFGVIPIRLEREFFAFITTSSSEANAFSEETIQLYQIIAERGALALREARLYDAVQLSLKRTNIRFAVSQALAQARTEEEVLDALIHQASFISGAHVTISTFVPAEVPTLMTRRSANFESVIPAFPLGLRFTRAEFPIQALIRAEEAFISNDLHNDPRVDPATLALAQSLGIASGGLFPLTSGNELVGVVNVLSEQSNFFSDPASTYLYESLAEQGSVALRAARLFDETQETAERLKELDRLKSEFLANMSHELRTPLNSIIGYAEIMLMGINGELGEDNIEDVNAIRTSGQHLLRLINDILDLAKIEAGRMTLDSEEVSITTLLEEIRVAHLALIHKKDVELRVSVEPMALKVQADRLRLNQILTNLISNAIKFTETGHVLVRAKQDNDEWMRIEVEDTGVGIESENLEAIFEEFRQADGSSTRRAEGTGLGLAITRRLVQMHGGIITVESKVNEGSTFTVRLPINALTSYLN